MSNQPISRSDFNVTVVVELENQPFYLQLEPFTDNPSFELFRHRCSDRRVRYDRHDRFW